MTLQEHIDGLPEEALEELREDIRALLKGIEADLQELYDNDII